MLQLEALLMSTCSFLVSSVNLIICIHLVSSAKIKGIAELMHSGKSLIKINKRGPNTLR